LTISDEASSASFAHHRAPLIIGVRRVTYLTPINTLAPSP